MTSESSSLPIFCREVFDENSHPSVEEVSEYAKQIGIDPSSEGHLLPLAKEGLMQALPTPWKAYYDEKQKALYYFNSETKVSQWEHPVDQVYKSIVQKAKTNSERGDSILEDTCVSLQDLLTYEEEPKQYTGSKNDMKDKMETEGISSIENSLEEELSLNKKINKKSENIFPYQKPYLLAPIRRKPLAPLAPIAALGDTFLKPTTTKKVGDSNTFPRTMTAAAIKFQSGAYLSKDDDNSEDEGSDSDSSEKKIKIPAKAPNSQGMNKGDKTDIIDLSFNPRSKENNGFDKPASKGFEANQSKKGGLTLMGGGSVFLKSNRSQGSTEMNDGSIDNPKGILRDRNYGELIFKPPTIGRTETLVSDAQALEDDRKIVRFNLEQSDIGGSIDYSPSPSSNSSSDVFQGKQGSVISVDKIENPFNLFNSSRLISRRNSDNIVSNNEMNILTRNRKLVPMKSDDNMKINSVLSKIEKLEIDKPNSGKPQEYPSVTSSPTRKLIKPHPGDFIKPNLFQKPFEKLSDILKTTSPDSDSESDLIEMNKEHAPHPTSSNTKTKLSINLMECVESEPSIGSPDIDDNSPRDILRKASPNIPQKSSSMNYFSKSRLADSLKLNSKIFNEKNDDVRKISAQYETELNEIKIKLNSHLKEVQGEIEKEHRSKIEAFKENLQKKLNGEIAELEKILNANHEMEIKKSNEKFIKLRASLVQKNEEALENEKIKLSKELCEMMNQINELHVQNIINLKQEKVEELNTLSKNIKAENEKQLVVLREQFYKEFEVEKVDLLEEKKVSIEKLKLEHETTCNELRNDYRSEVELLRSQQAAHLSALRDRVRKDRETCVVSSPQTSTRDDLSFERLRCDKRLLEDKYRCLKEKYVRLKTDVKISIERRNKRREQSATTGSETDKSHSNKTAPRTDKLGEDDAAAQKDETPIDYKNSSGLHVDIQNGGLKNANNNHNSSKNDNNNMDSFQIHLLQNESTSKQYDNLLNISMTDNSHLSPDHSRMKSPNIRDRSPNSRFLKDNENSIGYNDYSFSQSDSHTVSHNKSIKKVLLVEDPNERYSNHPRSSKLKSFRKSFKVDRFKEASMTDYQDSSDTGLSESRQVKESTTGRARKKLFTRLKSASTSRLNYCPSSKYSERSYSPIENLRQQLRQLEDLEEQFPDITLNADTTAFRLRYPFADARSVGGELGFLRHRALVEKEGVRRTKAALRRRTDLLRQKKRSPAPWQEECEITDMEVSLHRTKAILGEKVIRLRHIEKSLRKLQDNQNTNETITENVQTKVKNQENKQDATLSDISSHSSGFSSTEAQSDNNQNAKHSNPNESNNEIINNLQSLNTEIQDIWQVLNAQQQMNVAKVLPVGQFLYTDLGLQLPLMTSNTQNLPSSIYLNIPMANVQQESLSKEKNQPHLLNSHLSSNPAAIQPGLSSSVATSLVERTKNLRDWLKQQAAL